MTTTQVKVVTGKDGQTVTPVAISTQLPPNVSAAFSTQPQFQVRHQTRHGPWKDLRVCVCVHIALFIPIRLYINIFDAL